MRSDTAIEDAHSRRRPGDADRDAIAIVVSSRGGARLAERRPVRFRAAQSDETAALTVGHETRQTIIGFGASFSEAGMICLNALDRPAHERVLAALFDPEIGAGLSAMKTVIAATDFMAAGPFYSYAETPGDMTLSDFSIARDLGPDGLVTFIKRAQAHGRFVLQATMDYPPDWMLKDAKTDQDIDPRYYPLLAQYYLRYIRAYAEQGIRIDHLSPFNEPGNYTKIAPDGVRDLIKLHLGPLFAREGVETALQVNDGQFRFATPDYVRPILADPEARRFVKSVSYHGYDYMFATFPTAFTQEALVQAIRATPPLPEHGYTGPEYAFVACLAETYPGLPLWMTETCYFEMGEAKAPWQPKLPRDDFDDGEFWGLQIAAEIEAGASGWTYWNLILDEKGGPALADPEHGNPEHNVQQPVVVIDRTTKQVAYTGLYYYLAHFSRFVLPGSVRLAIDGAVPQVKALAFARPDGRHAAVLINGSDEPVPLSLAYDGRIADLELDTHSVSSLLWVV